MSTFEIEATPSKELLKQGYKRAAFRKACPFSHCALWQYSNSEVEVHSRLCDWIRQIGYANPRLLQ